MIVPPIEQQTEYSSLSNEDFIAHAARSAPSSLLMEALFRLMIAVDMVHELQEAALHVINA